VLTRCLGAGPDIFRVGDWQSASTCRWAVQPIAPDLGLQERAEMEDKFVPGVAAELSWTQLLRHARGRLAAPEQINLDYLKERRSDALPVPRQSW